ncbi:MAG TPA: helix-turn-helix domain-containing protein [Pseudonocardia sp.]|nr:helix-turn-helix domain-containing protein [Pseudonocardia sp.]
MSRSGERWLTVGEASRALGVSRTTLLAAEEAGLIAPIRTPGGHRRYGVAELHRYLGRAEVPPVADDPADPPDAADPALATAARDATRAVVRALDARCAGVYLSRGGSLGFCAAFGIPRWLAERLAGGTPPRPVREALDAGHPHLFDPAAAAFPEPRSTGHGVALALGRGGRARGVLFVVSPAQRAPLPGELQVLDAARDLVTMVLDAHLALADLEHRMARIATLASP